MNTKADWTNEALDKALDLRHRIQSALGTEETGEALIDVARNALKAEMELAAHQRVDSLDAFDGQVQVEAVRAVIGVLRAPYNRFGAIKCDRSSASADSA
jgi:hypothetical protein